ncbi:MAG: DNA polymerase III subunit delta [Bacteroidales bacterium]|nr:DNA polymerase III subunit delta [Bacteroidales bacterium]
MAETEFNSILKDIRNKIVVPVYFLMGEESFYIDVIADYLEAQVLTETEKEFNMSILYGKDTDIPTIVSVARRYPMMASHNLVIVKEAQHIKNIEDVLPYVQKPLESTILVICYKYKTIDKRTKFYKELKKAGVVFEGRKLYDNEIPGWITSYVKKHGYRISPQAVQLLADHLGSNLGTIVNEVKKLFINIRKGQEITTVLIEENIGISKDFNVFEFQNALAVKNSQKAYQIAKYFADNPKSNPFVLTSGVLYQFFSKILLYHSLRDKSQKNVATELSINPFFVKQYATAAGNYSTAKARSCISLLRKYDMMSKGLDNESTDQGELLKELTWKMLN